MGFRFSRRIGILPGLKLNFSGNGVSLSAGVRGAHLNFGSRGTYASVGLPGTGLSYRQRIGGGRAYSAPASALTEDQIRSIGSRENDQAALKLFQEGTQPMSVSPAQYRFSLFRQLAFVFTRLANAFAFRGTFFVGSLHDNQRPD
jgi:Protein of unknown function (DUF4236)